VFTSVFFISIGMLLDLGFLVDNIWLVLTVSLVILVVKGVIASMAGLILGYPLRIAALTGSRCARSASSPLSWPVSEMAYGLMARPSTSFFWPWPFVTMALTPFLIMASPRISDFLAARLPWGRARLSRRQGLRVPRYPMTT
jgi:monovalent cation:H+ antiporter-2, CPA2 family